MLFHYSQSMQQLHGLVLVGINTTVCLSVGLNRDFFKLLNGRRDIAQTGYMHVNSILQQIFPLENAILMLCLPPPTRTGDCVPKVCNLAIHSRCSFCFMAFKHSRNELLSSCPILHCPSYV